MTNENDNNKLSIPQKFVIGGQKVGLQKKIADAQIQKLTDYSNFPNRLGLIMDDSNSMDYNMEKCHEAIDAFIKNCNSSDTAIALYPLNAEPKSLTNIFASIGIYAASIYATGGTPLYTKLNLMLEKENITRVVAFSDGVPTDYDDGIITKYVEKKIAIDTIFIGTEGARGYAMMQSIAALTGGIFLHFTDASVLAKSLKYLTPHYRAMLMDKNTKDMVEKGVL